jgi:hypothetical protein
MHGNAGSRACRSETEIAALTKYRGKGAANETARTSISQADRDHIWYAAGSVDAKASGV